MAFTRVPHDPPPAPGPLPQADVTGIARKWLDQTYARTSAAQTLDLYLPARGGGPFPVLVYIHGGGFASGDKRDQHLVPLLEGLPRGYALAAVNYRLSGEAVFPAGLQDVKAAIRWLRANARRYHLDGACIAAWGGSSGGNFAAMVCLTDSVVVFDDPRLASLQIPCSVQAAVDWYGPTDFLKMDAQLAASGLGPCDHGRADSPESRYLGQPIGEIPLKVELANPMTYVHERMPPLLIQHGRRDGLVPVEQSILLAERLRRYVLPDRYAFDILEEAGHADPLFETHENLERVFAFLDKYLK